jgi:hypothetical protein
MTADAAEHAAGVPVPHSTYSNQAKTATVVTLPDFYGSVIARNAPFHPAAEEITRASDNYAMHTLGRSWGQYARAMAGKFPLYAAYHFPDAAAPAEKVRTCADWYQWVFEFDDQVDERGPLANDAKGATRHGNMMLSIFKRSQLWTDGQSSRLREMFQNVWGRMKEGMNSCKAKLAALVLVSSTDSCHRRTRALRAPQYGLYPRHHQAGHSYPATQLPIAGVVLATAPQHCRRAAWLHLRFLCL